MNRIVIPLFAAAVLLAHPVVAQETNDVNAAWQHVLQLYQAPPAAANRPKQIEIDRLSMLEKEADAFWQRFPDDSHVWEAKLIVLRARLDRSAQEGKKPDLRAIESDVREITSAKAAPWSLRAEAAFLLLELRAQAIVDAKDSAQLAAFDEAAATYAKEYPQSRETPGLPWFRMDLYEQTDPAKAEALLKKFAEDKDPRVAFEAKRRLKTKEVLKTPLDLKFTAVDGKEFSLTNWRGKVVLVDFWATWCGPCRMEIPRVVETYKKLHEKGFEIVGISLDQNKDKLLEFTKQKEMPWPQYFDGRTWENKISSSYGITGIPSMWLVDKKGYVRLTNARENLEGNVTKLLAE